MTADYGLVLRLKHFLPFPREVVYRALTVPAELAKWWGPRGFRAPEVDFTPRVGGSFRIAMQPPQGELFYLSGEFREVDPPARLAYSFSWSPPDPDDRETLVDLSLQSGVDGTEVCLIHSGFATEQRRALHEAGWSESLARLEQALGRTRGQPRSEDDPGVRTI
jgi:uncharacterized protein YndB with AHSA1/START domain